MTTGPAGDDPAATPRPGEEMTMTDTPQPPPAAAGAATGARPPLTASQLIAIALGTAEPPAAGDLPADGAAEISDGPDPAVL